MEYYNEDYEAIVEANSKKPADEIDNLLKDYPKAKLMLASLIGLIEMEALGLVCVDDWECDLSNAVWAEVSEVSNRKTKRGCYINRQGSFDDVKNSLKVHNYSVDDLTCSMADERKNKNRKSVLDLLKAELRKKTKK